MEKTICAKQVVGKEFAGDMPSLTGCDDDPVIVLDDDVLRNDASASHGAVRKPAVEKACDETLEEPVPPIDKGEFGDNPPCVEVTSAQAACQKHNSKPRRVVVPFVAFVSLCAGMGSALAMHVFPADAGIPVTAEASEEASSTGDEDTPQLPQTGPDLPDGQIEQVERERTSDAQWAVVSEARRMGAAGPSMCLMWVNDVYERAGYGFERLWAASEACQQWCHETNRNELRPGMIVAVEATDTSPLAGHVGIYLGHGEIASNETWGGEGVIRTRGVDDWIAMFGKVDEVRWGWPEGRDLSRETGRRSTSGVDRETASPEFPN